MGQSGAAPALAGPRSVRRTARQELDRLEEKNRNLRRVTTEVLTLATELRKGTIDRIMAMSDLELCLQALLGTLARTGRAASHGSAAPVVAADRRPALTERLAAFASLAAAQARPAILGGRVYLRSSPRWSGR
jgi:hypothetical protein